MLFHSGKYFTFLNLSHMGKEKYCSHQPPEAFIHKVIRGKNFTYVAFVSTRSSFVQLYERGIVEPKIKKVSKHQLSNSKKVIHKGVKVTKNDLSMGANLKMAKQLNKLWNY